MGEAKEHECNRGLGSLEYQVLYFAEAFPYCIDTIRTTLSLWKKIFGAGDESWVDGLAYFGLAHLVLELCKLRILCKRLQRNLLAVFAGHHFRHYAEGYFGRCDSSYVCADR